MISGPGSTSKINVDPTSSTLNAVGSGGRDARKRELMKAHRAVPNGAQETWRVSALKAIRSEVTYCRCGAVLRISVLKIHKTWNIDKEV
jgi:hypothetical protein